MDDMNSFEYSTQAMSNPNLIITQTTHVLQLWGNDVFHFSYFYHTSPGKKYLSKGVSKIGSDQ